MISAPDEGNERAPGLGPGFVVLLVVVGLLLLLLGWGAVVLLLDLVRSLTENLNGG